MGFGSSLKSFTSNPGRMALAVGTAGGSEALRAADKSFGLKDMLLGKKSSAIAAGHIIAPEQQALLDVYSKELGTVGNINPEALAAADIAKQEQQIRGSAADQERQAETMVAQRGLGKSSVGLNAILGAKRDLNDRIIQSRAMSPLLQQQYQDQKINRLSSIGGGINSALQLYNPGQAGGVRQGGLISPLLGIGGGVAGGMAAGPLGIAPGMQAGSGLGSAFSNLGR